MNRRTFRLIIFLAALILFSACSSNWDDKYANTPFKSVSTSDEIPKGTLIAEKDWSGVADDALPWIQFADPENGFARGGNDGIEITVTEDIGQLWQPQAMIVEGFNLKKGRDYLVIVTAKLPCDGQIQINMGSWEVNWQYDFPVIASGNFQEIECEFHDYAIDATDAHVLFQCGNFVGTTIVKKIQVYDVTPNPETPDIVAEIDWTQQTELQWRQYLMLQKVIMT